MIELRFELSDPHGLHSLYATSEDQILLHRKPSWVTQKPSSDTNNQQEASYFKTL